MGALDLLFKAGRTAGQFNPKSPIDRAVRERLLADVNLPAIASDSQLAKHQRSLALGPRGEVYTFPQTEFSFERQVPWKPLREAINKGIIDPAYSSPTPPSAKARSAARLADAVSGLGLPRDKWSPPHFEALAMKFDPSEEAVDAIAALSGLNTTRVPGAGYLYDLAAGPAPSARGQGAELLTSILQGPVLPDVSTFYYTPLPGAREFYKKKFGAEYISPGELKSDAVLNEIFDNVGMLHNVEDLGAGFIKRAEGGLVKMADGGSLYAAMSRNPASESEREHARNYNRLGDELRRQYGGKSGSITDRAKNYAGGWDYATRNPDGAETLARMYQFMDYLRGDEQGKEDAVSDLFENLQGIRDAKRFVGPPDPYNQLKSRAVRWAKQNPRMCSGGLAQMQGVR